MQALRFSACAALLGGLTLAPTVGLADGSGTLSDSSLTLHYDGGPFIVPNPTPDPAGADPNPFCEPGTPACEVYDLTVNISDAIRNDPAAADFYVDIALGFTDAQADMDLYLYGPDGQQMSKSTGSFGAQELISLPLDLVPNGTYQVRVIPYVIVPADQFTLDIGLTGYSPSKSQQFLGALNALLLLPLAALALLRRRARR